MIRHLLQSGLLLLALCGWVRAQGGPPLITDDPGTPGNGNWEINLAVTDDSSRGRHSLEVPIVDINYGAGDHLQLKFEVPWLLQTGGGPTFSEMGKSDVGVKWRFADQEKHGLDISTYPQLAFNSPGPAQIEARGVEFLLPLQFVRTQGRTQVNWDVGYNFHEHGPGEWSFGFAGGYQLSKKWQGLGEIHAVATRDFSETDFLFQAGFRRDLTKRYTLLFAAGRGLSGSVDRQPDFTGYIGLQLHFGKHIQDAQ